MPGLIKTLKSTLKSLHTRNGHPLYSNADIRQLDEWQRKDASALVEELLTELKSLLSKLS